MSERVFAAIVLAVCALLLLRLMLGAPRRHRLDAALRRAGAALRRAPVQWRRRRAARRGANEAFGRARAHGDWDGNVYTPKSLRKPRRDKMH